ncbi:T6SS phospholipase effector Tle1-like catalytic domain-containing protein [Dyella flagellata]|uniref:T6SS Phospholipase effector Tle1-like catalytic domain-containing protein n=1 Tax=Dyella flagellata TaxID=1867833 RepID=A0ABQ5X8X1_9GAMM|nr:DUF2235 domain-containing protein [Dyella flagellata]GLQ87717.1 hypothetical protein GCM10007898_12840 [Dyella flagellata]
MKRLIICADGTWNIRDQVGETKQKRRPTNVTKLARSVLPQSADGIDQVVFYHDGVGTGHGLDKWTGGAFGSGVEQNVRELYRAIVYNYAPGDELYLFGFSRGAFTVRTLSGFMNFAGLIEKGDDYFVPDLYACYVAQQGPGTDLWAQANRHTRHLRPCPPIRMIGVWDTVGALGAPGLLGQLFNANKYKYHDISLTSHIHHAYQALAIDERRKPFLPSIWERPVGWAGVLEQVWFSGVHCNVGGGYTPDGLANGALHWMADKARGLGMEFDQHYLAFFEPHYDSYLANSMTLTYRLLRPVTRPVCRGIDSCESIHSSAFSRMNDPKMRYRPANVATSSQS